jgi:transcriptional regulator with XRE-family HTH domain
MVTVQPSPGYRQVVAGDTAPSPFRRHPAETVDSYPGNGQKGRCRKKCKTAEHIRMQPHQVKIRNRVQAVKQPFHATNLNGRRRVGFGFQFDHQVPPAAVAINHLGQRGNQGESFPDVVQGGVPDSDLGAKQATGVRVVKHHGDQVARPAHIQFDAPDPGVCRRIKGRQGVFESTAVVVLTAVGNDATGSEQGGRGSRTGPAATDRVDQAVKNALDPFFHPYLLIPHKIHSRINPSIANAFSMLFYAATGSKKAFACEGVWVIGTLCPFRSGLLQAIIFDFKKTAGRDPEGNRRHRKTEQINPMKTEKVGQRIRTFMNEQKLSLEALAGRTGLETGFLSTIIEDDVYPSLGPLLKIARALDVRLGTFLDDQISRDPLVVRRADRKEELSMLRGKDKPVSLRFYSLGSGKSDRHMEPFYVELLPESEKARDLSSHEGEEFIVVYAGRVKVTYGTETVVLEAGDSIYYNSIVPHYVSCKGAQPAAIYAVLYIPR